MVATDVGITVMTVVGIMVGLKVGTDAGALVEMPDNGDG